MAKSQETFTSALTPEGPVAESISHLMWVMIGAFGAVFVVVMLLLVISLIAKRRSKYPTPPLGDVWFISIGGILIPGLILTFVLIYTLLTTSNIQIPETTSLTVKLTGHMWWWHVEYPDSGVTLANEIYVPVGEAVKIELRSADVIHSLWVPSLGGKTDLIPGHVNYHWFKADRPGVHRGQCAEFCGLQHAKMALNVIALEKEEFQKWLQSKQKAVSIPDDPRLLLGYQTFMRVGCAECHAIKGTDAIADVGPDLTHIGSRLSLGAGTIPNSKGSLAGWILNPQEIKPGNKMPRTYLEPDQLHALVSYLMTLD